MSREFFEKTQCRLCGSGKLTQVIELTATPPANAFVPPEVAGIAQACYPLVVKLCQDCHHLQLGHVVDPEVLFRDYVYVSGTSPSFRRHFKSYAEDMATRAHLRPGDLAFDIGSNDGTLLRSFKELGMSVLGVDPARAIARQATADGIETLDEFFTPDLAGRIRRERGAARSITANNVFAHIDDLSAVTEGVQILLADDGLFAFEVSYLVDVLNDTLFDTIYHEHLDYHAVTPLCGFFLQHGLRVIDAKRVATHGGSVRVYVGHSAYPWPPGQELDELLQYEQVMRLSDIDTYSNFSRKIDQLGAEVRDLTHRLKAEGKRIAGYGAPAKATTLLYHFGLGDVLEFVVDDSPLKQGLLSPGHHIPVLASAALTERKPDYALLLAWNFADEIIAKNNSYLDAGGRFIVPLPRLRLV